MRLRDEQFEEIKRIITETFVKYKIKSMTIDPLEEGIAHRIPIIPYSAFSEQKRQTLFSISKDGFSFTENGVWKIYYNDICQYYKRVRYTIMHEIGHYILSKLIFSNNCRLIVTMIINMWLCDWRKYLLFGRLRHFPQKENEVIEMSGIPGY